MLNRDGYGFMEWVEHRPCSTEAELARFYRNAGRVLALLYLLGCTDCHHENLIASGEQLLLIDTETLLEADHRDLISDDPDGADAVSALQISLLGSVLRTGLLPQWQMVGVSRRRPVDMSALGIQPPPVEREQPCWLGLNSDGMLNGRSLRPCELPTSLPVELGSPERLTDFVEELCRGFRLQLQETQRLRPELLAALKGFRGQPRRLVARSTRVYFAIQLQMLEPGALRTAAAHGLKLEQLCRSFVLAREQPQLYGCSVRENLTLWRDDIDDERLEAACADAQILDLIRSLPEGFDSLLKEGSRNLSGGQRQRLEIARALVQDPAILVLDEATSALDAETERLMAEALRRRGCTQIIVAHRLSTIRDADEILVMEQGVVVQRGRHEEMSQETGTPYARLLAEVAEVEA